MSTLLYLAACTGPKTPEALPEPEEPRPADPAPQTPAAMSFSSLDLTEALDRTVIPTATDRVTIDGVDHTIGLHILGRSGAEGFGVLYDEAGQALAGECHSQDFNSLMEAHGQLYLMSHFECTPGALYVSAIAADEAGELTVTGSKPVDWSAWGGLWFPCAGQVTRWGSHLGSEEYEPNARNWQADGTMKPDPFNAWAMMMRYPTDPGRATPYNYGYITEVTLDADGSSQATKHPALGRFSHELGFVVGDDRTVYLSDDGTAVGWFMFVADTAADLTSGHLYAARLTQNDDETFAVGWIPLGHATDAQVRSVIDAGVRFTDLFEVAQPESGACPDGFAWTHHSHGQECLKLAAPSDRVPDPAMAASRLETRRYAAMLGATTELEKAEGITWDADTQQVYLAVSKVGGRMAAEPGAPADHIALPPNPCGAVWGGSATSGQVDTDGDAIDSPHVLVAMGPVLQGRPLDAPDDRGNACDPDAIANPDNITLLPGHGLMIVAEDTSAHRINVGWAHDLRSGSLTRVMAAPRGAEVTGVHWIPDLRGHGYLTVAFQHPWAKVDDPPDTVTDEDRRSFTGYLGPFPSPGPRRVARPGASLGAGSTSIYGIVRRPGAGRRTLNPDQPRGAGPPRAAGPHPSRRGQLRG